MDDTDPDLLVARTGISYDTDSNEEEVDRSYIMLDVHGGSVGSGDALGDVNTDNITVVGSTIVGVIHPSVRPHINRGETPANPPTGAAPKDPGAAPDVVAMPDDPKTRHRRLRAPGPRPDVGMSTCGVTMRQRTGTPEQL